MGDVAQPLQGFAFTGYRSVRGPLQYIGPLGKVNLVAGQNNSGKSNVLRMVNQLLSKRGGFRPEGLDLPRDAAVVAPFEYAIAVAISRESIEEACAAAPPQLAPPQMRSVLEALFADSRVTTVDPDLVWFRFRPVEGQNGVHTLATEHLEPRWAVADNANLLAAAASVLVGRSGSVSDNIGYVLSKFADITLPPTMAIEAFRQIGPGANDAPSSEPDGDRMYMGRGLIRALQRLQSPDILNQDDKAKFEAINRFVQNVLDDPTARLEIPHDAQSILVRRGGLVLPLDHLGTGVHQVVILAVAATVLEGHVVCMEEPEVHLHPLLQRKLVRYLGDETSNQYLIATHSAHMLDHERAKVFHTVLGPEGTEIRSVGSPQQVSDLCADLGYRPSDLLQANAVLWVEGPSDRVYLRHWIGLDDSELVEGIHYSIMFYGGRLLNHLSAHDPDVNDFISLRRLNRHIAVLIDSDKTSAHAAINDTKKRVKSEFEDPSYPGFAWITDGRTIENYVPLPALTRAFEAAYPGAVLKYTGDKWSDPLESKGAPTRVDKIRLADSACALDDVEWLKHRDLGKRVKQVVHFIREANGLPRIVQ